MSRVLVPIAFMLLLAWHDASSAGDTRPQRETEPPRPGSLVLPDEMKQPDRGGEKKCMTVCARYGEECMLINKGAGGMERKCRRTCQQFAEECF